jgi:hypothetical protein
VTIKDWFIAAAAAVTILSALGGLYVSVRMRERDREDFEALRDEHDSLRELVASTREELAELKGKIK